MIDDWTIRKVRDAARIEDIVGDYISLKRQGSELTGLCPFHDDRHTGSFMISPSKNIATCFVCQETYDPIAFVMKKEGCEFIDAVRLIAKRYGIYIDEEQAKLQPRIEPRPLPPPLPKRMWPLDWVASHMADGSDTFVNWITGLPWDGAQRSRVQPTLDGYAVGHSHFYEQDQYGGRHEHDYTLFWQIDENFNVHNAHFMKYQSDGHRIKDKAQCPNTWLHARMKKAKVHPFDEDKEDKSFCLFGQHLLLSNPNAIVNIVESEKTAIFMTIAYGCTRQQVWMACYGLSNLTNKNDLLRPLINQGKTIVLYPDHDGVEKWKEVKRQLNYKNLSIETRHVTKWWLPEMGDKADIADVILYNMKNDPLKKPQQISKPINEWATRNPYVKTLIDNLGLE